MNAKNKHNQTFDEKSQGKKMVRSLPKIRITRIKTKKIEKKSKSRMIQMGSWNIRTQINDLRMRLNRFDEHSNLNLQRRT